MLYSLGKHLGEKQKVVDEKRIAVLAHLTNLLKALCNLIYRAGHEDVGHHACRDD